MKIGGSRRDNNKKIDGNAIITDHNYYLIYIHTGLLFLVSFILNSPEEIFSGFWKILISPSNLLTDYMALANPGAALFNSAITTLFTGILLNKLYSKVTGPLLAAVMTVSGFSLFGKNLFNSFSIMAGVYLFAKITGKKYSDVTLTAVFATGLAPLVSEIAFGFPNHPFLSLFLSQLCGIAVGLVIYPLSDRFFHYHSGFSLYNVGFSAGVLAIIITGIFTMLNLVVSPSDIIYSGPDTAAKLYFIVFSILLFITGFILSKGKLDSLKNIFRKSGRSITDFILEDGFGPTLMNMALTGMVGLLFVLITGSTVNGPVLGALLTMTGFGAFGKTPVNIVPVITGIAFGVILSSSDFSSTSSVITCLFGTSLAPISGHYGPLVGFIAGFLHAGLSGIMGSTHGGINLYNNGFSSGFVAAFILAIMDYFKKEDLKDEFEYNEELNTTS